MVFTAMANVVPLDHRKAIGSLEVKVDGLDIDSKDEDSFKSNASTVCRWPLDDLGIQQRSYRPIRTTCRGHHLGGLLHEYSGAHRSGCHMSRLMTPAMPCGSCSTSCRTAMQ